MTHTNDDDQAHTMGTYCCELMHHRDKHPLKKRGWGWEVAYKERGALPDLK